MQRSLLILNFCVCVLGYLYKHDHVQLLTILKPLKPCFKGTLIRGIFSGMFPQKLNLLKN